jgi:hypothetical protein
LGLTLFVPAVCAQQPVGESKRDAETLADPRAMEFYGNAVTVVNLPIEEVVHRTPHLRGMEIAERQDELADILDKTGKTVASFFKGFPNTACEERISSEYEISGGLVEPGNSQTFRYLALNRPSTTSTPLDEFRTDSKGNQAAPSGFLVTKGFVSTEAIFHPENRSEAVFRLLGRQKVKGRETYIVGFAQIPGKARLVGKAEFGGMNFVLTLLQGVAWIDSENYQIIRIYTDLLAPRPDVGLKQESTDLTYERVQFKTERAPLWLPHQVVVTERVRDQTYRNVHTYSDFRVFRVETGEKQGGVK